MRYFNSGLYCLDRAVGGACTPRQFRGGMVLSAIASILVALLCSGNAAIYGIHGDEWAYEGFVEEIKREVKPRERVFMEDLSGRLALMSQRSFVSGDGLVNSNRYFNDFLKRGQVESYLRIHGIEYFLTSNIQCEPYRKRMPWTRDIVMFGGQYRVIVDIQYLTNTPVKPSVLEFPAESLVFDRCVNGIRELLFRVK